MGAANACNFIANAYDANALRSTFNGPQDTVYKSDKPEPIINKPASEAG